MTLCIIWDFDGTLYDTNGDFISTIRSEKALNMGLFRKLSEVPGVVNILCTGREQRFKQEIFFYFKKEKMDFDALYFWPGDDFDASDKYWHGYYKWKIDVFRKYRNLYGEIIVIDDNRIIHEMCRYEKNIYYLLV